MDLSIVTVSFNVSRLLSECLASVYASLARSPLRFEVWAVDNASHDDSVEMVRRDFPAAQLIVNERNLGFAAASNQGLQRSQGRYVLLLNPDTRVLEDALQMLVAFMDSRPRAGAAGANTRFALTQGGGASLAGAFQHSAFRFPTLAQIFLDFFPLHHRLTDSALNGRYPRRLYERGLPFPIDHPLGAAMIVRREAIQEVGPLDERFFMYCEEVDWAMRLRRAGWEIYCVPAARVVHHAGQSTRQFRDQMFVALWRSRYLLFEKHYSLAFRQAARLIVHLGLWREMRRTRKMALDAAERETRRRAYETVWRM